MRARTCIGKARPRPRWAYGSAAIAILVGLGLTAPSLAAGLGERYVGVAGLAPEGGPACAGGEIYDDGSPEGGFGWADFITAGIYVQRFSPASDPSQYTDVCLCWQTVGPSMTFEFLLVIFDDDGPSGGPGTRLLDWPVTIDVTSDIGDFFTFDIRAAFFLAQPEAIWIGAQWDGSVYTDIFLCADGSPSTPAHPIYSSNNGGGNWFPVSSATQALLVRAVSEVPEMIFSDGFESGDTSGWTATVP